MADSLNANMDALSNELSVTKSQLASKRQAISILKQQLEDSRKESNQLKTLLDQLQQRYRNLRKTLDSDLSSQFLGPSSQKKLLANLKVKLSEIEMQNRILVAEISHLRKRNSELAEDVLLKNTNKTNIGFEFADALKGNKSSVVAERKSLISQLEFKTIQCQRLRRELELCNEEKQELISELKNNPKGECDSARCKALFQENQLLSRHICRLEADKKLLIHSLAKYQESTNDLTSLEINSDSFVNGPCDFSTITPSYLPDSGTTESPDHPREDDGKQTGE